MRVSIKGEIAIAKETWHCKGFAHQDFAAELAELISIIKSDCPSYITDALTALKNKHLEIAGGCEKLANDTKRGRPKAQPKPTPASNPLVAAALGIPYFRKNKPGRPRKFGRKHDALTYVAVEERRTQLAASNCSKPTVKAAIDSINEQFARSQNKRVGTAQIKNYQRVRAAYGRGKRAVAT